MRNGLIAILIMLGGFVAQPAHAQDVLQGNVDLILPPSLSSPDAPFYREAKVKVGDTLMPIKEGNLPSGTLAQFQPDKNEVIVSNNPAASEVAKGQALLDVVSAMQANSIATAAGK